MAKDKTILEQMNVYANDCINGAIPACQWVQKSCERHFADLERDDVYFSEEHAKRVCAFVQLMRHVKGQFARQCIRLQPWQVFFVGSLFGWMRKDTKRRRYTEANLTVSRKQGKGQWIETPIWTTNGFKKLLDVHVGDEVFDECGNRCNVIAESEINHLPCFEVAFSNGEKIICDIDHSWQTIAHVNMPGVRKGRSFGVSGKQIRNIENIYETQTYGTRGDRNHSVELPQPINETEKNLPIHPYILGLWLGNGNSIHAVSQITCNSKDDDFFSEYFVKEKINFNKVINDNKKGCVKYTLYPFTEKRKRYEKNFLRRELEKLELCGNKHIPEIYLHGSVQQRIELLQGLMDTDGYMDSKGRGAEFCTVLPKLAEDFCVLLSTLGLKYSVNEKMCRCGGRELGHNAYSIKFCCNRDYLDIFKLPRKLARQKVATKTGVKSRARTVQIASVKKVSSVPTKCIQVDSPSNLFLTGRTMIPTHNSLLLNSLGHYCLTADQEMGAECILAASKESQAKDIFGVALQMVNMNKDYREFYHLKTTSEVIRFPITGSYFTFVIGTPVDGSNPHFAGIDEYHQHKTNGAYEALKTGMGARTNPILLSISTAGSDFKGPYKRYLDYCRKVTSGVIADDRLFSMEYTIDQDDDWQDFSVWAKANPNMGVSVQEEYLRSQLEKAKSDVSSRSNILTKHLDVWNNDSTSWIDMSQWMKCGANISMDDFKDEQCWLGLDLASRVDLCSLIFIFRRGGQYYVFGKHYLNRERVNRTENQHFRAWEAQGYLTVTEGAQTDFTRIESDLQELATRFRIQELAYDPREATYLMQHVREWAAFPCVEVHQGPRDFSEPMKVLEAKYLSKEITHANDPVINWAASNVILKNTSNKLFYPARRDQDDKIDPIVAMIMALGRAELVHKEMDFSIFAI